MSGLLLIALPAFAGLCGWFFVSAGRDVLPAQAFAVACLVVAALLLWLGTALMPAETSPDGPRTRLPPTLVIGAAAGAAACALHPLIGRLSALAAAVAPYPAILFLDRGL